jgi:hypothetical protein
MEVYLEITEKNRITKGVTVSRINITGGWNIGLVPYGRSPVTHFGEFDSDGKVLKNDIVGLWRDDKQGYSLLPEYTIGNSRLMDSRGIIVDGTTVLVVDGKRYNREDVMEHIGEVRMILDRVRMEKTLEEI